MLNNDDTLCFCFKMPFFNFTVDLHLIFHISIKMVIIGTVPSWLSAKKQQLYGGSLICKCDMCRKIINISYCPLNSRVTFKITGQLKACSERHRKNLTKSWKTYKKYCYNWSSTSIQNQMAIRISVFKIKVLYSGMAPLLLLCISSWSCIVLQFR